MNVWDWIVEIFTKYHMIFTAGMKMTILLGIFSIIFGVLIGTVVALLRISRFAVIRVVAAAYIDFLRSTPSIVQVSLIWFGGSQLFPVIPEMFGLPSVFFYGVIALSLNSSAYVAEIMRAGIQSVDKGQMEAARSLGMPHSMAMRHIIMPQAVKTIIPALGNEFVVVMKETAVVSTIGVADLMYNAGVIRSVTFRGLEPYLIIMVYYFVIVFTLSKLVGLLERRLRASD